MRGLKTLLPSAGYTRLGGIEFAGIELTGLGDLGAIGTAFFARLRPLKRTLRVRQEEKRSAERNLQERSEELAGATCGVDSFFRSKAMPQCETCGNDYDKTFDVV